MMQNNSHDSHEQHQSSAQAQDNNTLDHSSQQLIPAISVQAATPYPHPLIAQEGWGILAIAACSTLVAYCFLPSVFFYLSLAVLIFSLQFFRDPPRTLASLNPNDLISPADGRIVFIGQTINPYTEQNTLKISVFMNVFNVHSNRIPIAGTVQKIAYHPGSFLNAALDKASEQNERNAIIIHTPQQTEITFVQIAGLVARRIVCYAKVGQTMHVGQRYGFIRFGSRVDVYLPLHYQSNVALGQNVQAGHTVLAQTH